MTAHDQSAVARRLVVVMAVLMVSCTCAKSSPPVVASTPATVAKKTLAHEPKSAVGTNLSGVADWSSAIPFIDVFKSSRPWISGNDRGAWDDGRSLDLDERGWIKSLKPGQVARTLMLWDLDRYPAGRYTVLYDGRGEIEYATSASNRFVADASKPGRHLIDVDPARGSQGIQLIIVKTDPADPIRNIRVLLPGFQTDDGIFNPKFLERLEPYSVIRFMDWMHTNDSQISHWGERPQVADARWSDKGVPLEIIIALAERLGAEPWFNMPHRADDDYVRNFAAQVARELDPSLRAWVEFSNEVWNGQFAQHREVRLCPQGQDKGDPYIAGLICYSVRAKHVLRQWTEVFAAHPERLVRVLAGQSANAWAAEQILQHDKAHAYADVFAIAPYFGPTVSPQNVRAIEQMSVDQLFGKIRNEELPRVKNEIEEHAKIVARYKIPLVAYEGGQHLVGIHGVENNTAINRLLDAVNRDPRIESIYLDYLRDWRAAGGTLFVNYTHCNPYTKWGRFGVIEYIEQPLTQAPKLRALLQFMRDNPVWW